MAFSSINFIGAYNPTDKIIKLHNSLNIKVGGFKVEFFQKAMVEGKLLWINLSDLLLSLEFSSNTDARQALINLNQVIEQLLPNYISSTGDKYFSFTQNIPSGTWTINHNLNKNPSVTITDLGGSIIMPDNITYSTLNSLTITFTTPQAGTAYCN